MGNNDNKGKILVLRHFSEKRVSCHLVDTLAARACAVKEKQDGMLFTCIKVVWILNDVMKPLDFKKVRKSLFS